MIKWFNNRKYWQKLLICYLLMAALPIAILGISSCTIASNFLAKQIDARLNEAAENTTKMLSEKINQINTLIDHIVLKDDFLQELNNAVTNKNYDLNIMNINNEKNLDSLKATMPEIERIIVYLPGNYYNENMLDSNSKLVYAMAANMSKGNDEIWQVNDNDLYVIKKITDPYSGKNLGYLTVVLDSQLFFKNQAILNEKEYAIIIHDSSIHDIYVGWNMKTDTGHITGQMLNNSADKRYYDFMGKKYIFSRDKIQELNWTLYYLVPITILTNSINQIVSISINISLICLIGVIFASFFISLGMSKKIKVLIDEMIRVGSGNIKVQISKKQSGDELGQLTTVFEDMVMKIDKLIKDVYESKVQQKEAELKALQAQINPHFLYNCLDNINWHAIMLGDAKISNVVTCLSDFYRTSLNKGKIDITINDELINARSYIDLQLELHDNSFQVIYEIDEDILEYKCIKLSLQPIVENAIEHGINSNVERKGIIKLTIKQVDYTIQFQVFNTGPQIDPAMVETILKVKTKGYGLANINDRIRLFFGEEYGVKIEPVKEGTLCTVTIPMVL